MEIQNKKITVTGKKTKEIQWTKNGKVMLGTIYNIKDSEEVVYDCPNKEYFDKLNIGDIADIDFKVVQKAGSNGTMYTNNKILAKDNPEIDIIKRLDEIKTLLNLLVNKDNKINNQKPDELTIEM